MLINFILRKMMTTIVVINTDSQDTSHIMKEKSFCKLTVQFGNLPVRPAKYRKVKILQVNFFFFFFF